MSVADVPLSSVTVRYTLLVPVGRDTDAVDAVEIVQPLSFHS